VRVRSAEKAGSVRVRSFYDDDDVCVCMCVVFFEWRRGRVIIRCDTADGRLTDPLPVARVVDGSRNGSKGPRGDSETRERKKMGDKKREAGRGLSAATIAGIGTKGSLLYIMPRAHTHIHCAVYIYCTRCNFGSYRKARGVGGRYECDCNEGALRGPLRGQVPRWVETDFNTFLNLLSSLIRTYDIWTSLSPTVLCNVYTV